ncbi:hypothetical protein UBN66_02680 [Helicobacter pylori]
MPLPFILGGISLTVAGYGVKKGIDAKDTNDKAKTYSKKQRNCEKRQKRGLSLRSLVANWLLQGLARKNSMF